MSKSINRYCNCKAGTCNGTFSNRRCAFKNVPKPTVEEQAIDIVLLETMQILKDGGNGSIVDTVWSTSQPNTTLYEMIHNLLKNIKEEKNNGISR